MGSEIEFTGIECDDRADALAWAEASGRGVAITLGGRAWVVEKAEAERLAAQGVEFAYLFDHEMPDGTFRIVTVPVND